MKAYSCTQMKSNIYWQQYLRHFLLSALLVAENVAKSTPKDSIFLNILSLLKSKMWEGIVLLGAAEF